MEKNKEKQLKWLFQQTKGIRKLLFLSTIFSAILASSQVALSYIAVLFMNVIEGTSTLSLANVVILGIILIILGCTSLLATTDLSVRIRNKAEEKIREKIIRSIYSRSLLHISKKHTSELMRRLMDDARAIPMFSLRLAQELLSDAIILIGSVVLMLTLSWQLSLIIFAIVITMTMLMVAVGKLVKKAVLHQNKQYDALLVNIQENVMKLLLFKAYNMLEPRIKGFGTLYANFAKASMKNTKISSTNMVISNAFNAAIMIVTFGLGSVLVMNGTITIAALVGISSLHGNLWRPLWNMSSHIQLFAESSASAQRIREILDMPQANEEPASNIGRLEGLA
ncbi:MAG: ABC transporter ATP-binding protein, partial [Defluviitaleaceae bacterium]|nr:ABC transporter ATP-binding protein [Defluviitaleaceae bacterium]